MAGRFRMGRSSQANASRLGSREQVIARYLAQHEVRKLQIGAGPKRVDGWLCSDLNPSREGTIRLDVTQPFPFPDGCLDYIYAEHLIEHLSWKQGQRMLAECRRVLRGGGILRVATPDLARLVAVYCGDAGAAGEQYLRYMHDRFTPRHRVHPAVLMNLVMHAWGHTFLYDAEMLTFALGDAGFDSIVQCSFGRSDFADLRKLERHHVGGNPAKAEAVRFETMIFEAAAPA
jgi:predicted SAM-dependent methyltransferase